MASISQAFDFIAIINLVERTDRHRECMRELKMIDLALAPGKVEFFPAHRGEALHGFPSLGAYGAFISHLSLIREARRRGVSSLLVLEDDFEISRKNVVPLEQIVDLSQTLPWDFLYLGHRLDLPSSPLGLVETHEPIVTTHAYAIRSSVFDSVIEYLEGCLQRPPGDPIGGPMHVDGALSMFRARNPEVVTLAANPSRVAQRSSRSDVNTSTLDQNILLAKAAGIARQAVNFWRQYRKSN